MDSNNGLSSRFGVLLIVLAMSLLVLLANKIVMANSKSETERIDGLEGTPNRADVKANTNIYSNNGAYFTSMEAEFEWDQIMLPDYDPGRMGIAHSIEREHDTGRRRRLEDNAPRYRTLRGLRDGN